MSSNNLWKRKVRTFLTILGVVIGTASIVVMISLGLGLNKATLEDIERYGGLTTITVRAGYGNEVAVSNGGGMVVYSEGESSGNEEKRVDDEAIKVLKSLEHVKTVSPVLEIYALIKQGAYENSLTIRGMDAEAMKGMKLELGEGRLPQSDQPLELLFGNQVLYEFYKPNSNQHYWQTGIVPDVDLMKKPLFVIFDTDAYYQSMDSNSKKGPEEGNGATEKVKPPKKYMLNGCGVLAGGPDDYGQNAYNVFCDLEVLKSLLKKEFKNRVIPGQPTRGQGKPYKEIFYNSAFVEVDHMDNMKTVQTMIRDLGYQADSNSEWIESMQSQARSTQAVLGGIGAVSLFVAAIGITNTMMMSIYERTKEIGIIKVLGCGLGNIRTMFLLEAGYIGFIGGAIGIGISYGISAAINGVSSQSYGTMMSTSYIPLWLSGTGLAFAVLVGMIAGFFPALRAMRLSPLAAIRNES